MPAGAGAGAGGQAAKAAGVVAIGGALLGLAAWGISEMEEDRKRSAPVVQMQSVPSAGGAAAAAAAPKRLLVLWDIDDTMTRSAHASGIGGGPLLQAVSEVVGRPITKGGLSFSGKTDAANVRALLAANGVDVDPQARADVEFRVFQALPAIMAAGVAEGSFKYQALPGVVPLIAELQQRPGVVQGLLTGNLEACCPVKLGAAGLDFGIFALGAYGEPCPDAPLTVMLELDL